MTIRKVYFYEMVPEPGGQRGVLKKPLTPLLWRLHSAITGNLFLEVVTTDSGKSLDPLKFLLLSVSKRENKISPFYLEGIWGTLNEMMYKNSTWAWPAWLSG